MRHYLVSTRNGSYDCYFGSHKQMATLFEKLGYIVITAVEIIE